MLALNQERMKCHKAHLLIWKCSNICDGLHIIDCTQSEKPHTYCMGIRDEDEMVTEQEQEKEHRPVGGASAAGGSPVDPTTLTLLEIHEQHHQNVVAKTN